MRNRQKTKTVGNTIVNEAAEGAVASKPSAMGSIGINHGRRHVVASAEKQVWHDGEILGLGVD